MKNYNYIIYIIYNIIMSNLLELLELIKTNRDNNLFNFVNKNLENKIIIAIKSHFPKLNDEDLDILVNLTIGLIDYISNFFNFKKTPEYYNQWYQNNYKDIKAVVLLLLPFLDDIKDNGKVLHFTNLNDILGNTKDDYIHSDVLKFERGEILKKHFYYSNIFIEFMKTDNQENKNKFLLVNNGERLIETFLFNNFNYITNTIKIISNKLFVNWFNIQPYNFDDYKDEMYQKTILDLNDLKSNMSAENIINNRSLHFSNFYGVCRNFIYENLKKIKWCIFCFNINRNQGYYFIQLLDKYLDLNLVINYNSYFELSKDEKKKFENLFKLSLIKLKNGEFIINLNKEIELFKTILIYLIGNYSDKNRLDKRLKQFTLDNLENIDEESSIYQNIQKLSYDDFINAYDYIDIVDIWKFLKETLDILKYNYFGKYLFVNNKINQEIYYIYGNLNLKNLYNYGKFISLRLNENKQKFYDKDFFKLSNDDRLDVFNKILNFTDLSNNQFNIDKNLRIQFNSNPPTGWFNNIKQNISNNIVDLVYETLIYNGIYTKFVPNLEYTDINLTDKRKHYAENIKTILKNPELKKGYYFMNNKPFEELNVYHKNKYTHYFDRLADTNWLWYTQYAMDWISQINFFNHLIHLNLIYITGSTGQGKTTQMPKLFCYGYKAIFLNPKPNIMHSQPRFDPTENQIKRISAEMGLDVEEEKKGKRFITNNYFLQFKHSKNEHTKDNCYHPTIIMMTDGTLLEILNRNVRLVEKYYDNKKNDWIETDQNKYDVVLIDEAHEHNKNMDMLLTNLRLTIDKNKDITLAIVSATMDDDEPIYRSYYQPINHRNLNLDVKYLDKRFHISPPGGTTQYKITEYFPYTTENPNYVLAELESRNRILETVRFIIQSSAKGQILVFTVGQAEIIDLVNKINSNTPSNVICVPFYSAMNQKYKEIIKDIDKELSRIKNYKSNVAKEWGVDFYQDSSVPNNIYDRAIIIATNVAEASITIPGLKFVVDNGFSKENKFDKTLNSSSLVIEPISEASRLQRKGRVGRNDTGSVYYMYPKGAREKIMPKYKITQEDFREIFLKILVVDDSKENIEGNLRALDRSGRYYLIHPFEESIKRNILNQIIKDNEIVNQINVNNFLILQSLLFNNLIVIKKNNSYYQNILDVIEKDFIILPTKLLEASNLISSKLKIDRNFSLILLMSQGFGKLNNGIKLINGIEMVEKNFLMIFDKKYFENYSDSFSDINTLVNILSLFDRFLPKNYFDILELIENGQDMVDLKLEDLKNKDFFKKYYLEYKNQYLKYKKNNDDFIYRNIFKNLENKNLINSSKGFLTFIKESNILQKDLTQNINQNYILFSEQNNVKPELIYNYFKKSIETLVNLFLLDIDINKNNKEENYIYLFKTKLRKVFLKYINYYGFEKEINHLILFLSYYGNFSIRYKTNHNFLNVHTKQPLDVKKINYKGINFDLSYVKNSGDFIVYLKNLSDKEYNSFSLYFNVNPKLIATFMPQVFNKNIFFNYFKHSKYNQKIKKYQLEKINLFSNSLNTSYQILYNYVNYDNNPFFDDFFEELSKALKNLKKNQ
jgi:hypothetical protein